MWRGGRWGWVRVWILGARKGGVWRSDEESRRATFLGNRKGRLAIWMELTHWGFFGKLTLIKFSFHPMMNFRRYTSFRSSVTSRRKK